MRKQGSSSGTYIVLGLIGAVFAAWLALMIAPSVSGGLAQIVTDLPAITANPLNIRWCGDSVGTLLVFLTAYALVVAMLVLNRKNYRYREEHGSAKWGNAQAVNRQFSRGKFEENKILTKHVSICLDGRKSRRNLNTMVVGGAGSGKTRFYAKPNLYQANSSFVITDPKGELLRDSGKLLERKGYNIRVLDLLNMEKSHHYNPMRYLENDNDTQRLVTNLFKATTPKGTQTQDPFWDNAAQMLLLALVFYLMYEAPPEEQNFSTVLLLLSEAEIDEEDSANKSPLDYLFEDLEEREPYHIAVKYYKLYRKGAGKTLKSIIITLVTRLEKFNLPSLAALTEDDDLDLSSIGTKKTAVFALIPDNDTSFNFLVSILYTQLFQSLFRLADNEYGGSLPVPVHFLMDEFANISLPDDFDKILSTMRSRNIFVSIILQNISQLKALFEKQWESIVGNCDEFLYLGGNESSTHELVSKLLGKETIDTNSFGLSRGRNGNYSTNYQNSGRDLLDSAEVRMLDNRYAILFIRGAPPIFDEKYDVEHHPNVKWTADGKRGEKYEHGGKPYTTVPEGTSDDANDKKSKRRAETARKRRKKPKASEKNERALSLLSPEEMEARYALGEKDSTSEHSYMLLSPEEAEDFYIAKKFF